MGVRPRRITGLANILLLCISLVVGYAVVEVTWRVYLYRTLTLGITAQILARIPAAGQEGTLAGASVYDMRTGHRYRPNIALARSSPFPVSWRTNRHGHISEQDYSKIPGPNEFRIGLVGDSFTANVTNTVRWGDVLQRQLNSSPEWRAAVNERKTLVINFGLDGIGLVQFDRVVENLVLPFSVDVLIVNLIRNDVIRRPYYRGGLFVGSEAEIRQYVADRVASVLLRTIYPEVFAVTIGSYFGVKPQLTQRIKDALNKDAMSNERFYDDPSEAAAVGRESVAAIRRYFPDALFLVHPSLNDYRSIEEQGDAEAFRLLTVATPEAGWVEMMDRLPRPRSKSELESWFNLPHDQHNSDLGLTIYGEAVAELLIERSRDRIARDRAR